jgi:2-polyprenyl-3-methyl-5-hydroxy-6-metoxy-1,4-benzoquinol methylase
VGDLRPETIRWRREAAPFEMTLMKYQLKNLLDLGKGQSTLDLGCNDGLITKELCKRFSRVVGVDASQTHIEAARRRVPEAVFHIALIEEFDPGDEFFDTIYMLNLLEHLDNPVEALKRVKSWLSPHGYVIIHVPNALSLSRRIGQKMGLISNLYELTSQDIEGGHKRFYDSQSLEQDIIASGLKVESMGSIFLKPFSNPQMEWFVNCEAWKQGSRGWGGEDKTVDWREKLCDALYEMAKELPQYSSPIWARCVR